MVPTSDPALAHIEQRVIQAADSLLTHDGYARRQYVVQPPGFAEPTALAENTLEWVATGLSVVPF
jgi:hypothetical protein